MPTVALHVTYTVLDEARIAAEEDKVSLDKLLVSLISAGLSRRRAPDRRQDPEAPVAAEE